LIESPSSRCDSSQNMKTVEKEKSQVNMFFNSKENTDSGFKYKN